MCVLERGCPSRGSCACRALPPAHLAQNTAGLKPDLPLSGLLGAAGSLTPGSVPTTMSWAPSLPPRTECKGGPSARVAKPGNPSLLGREPGPALYPLPSVNPTALPELPRGTGPRPAFSRHPALPGPRLWPSPRHPGPMSLYLSSMMPWASVSWTRPLLAAYQLPERAGAYSGPLLYPHPTDLSGR